VVGLIASAALLLMNSENFGYIASERVITIAICVASFCIVYFTRLHPILVIILAGITGLLVF
jgi:chromate transporter